MGLCGPFSKTSFSQMVQAVRPGVLKSYLRKTNPQDLFRAARVQNETAPEKILNRYENGLKNAKKDPKNDPKRD